MDTDDRAFVVWGIGLVVNLFVIYLYFGSNISLFGILLLLFFGWIPCTVPVAIISAIIGFCSFSDVFSGGSSSYSSSNSSSRKYGTRNKLYLSPGEKIMFHVETYEVFHGEGGVLLDIHYWRALLSMWHNNSSSRAREEFNKRISIYAS